MSEGRLTVLWETGDDGNSLINIYIDGTKVSSLRRDFVGVPSTGLKSVSYFASRVSNPSGGYVQAGNTVFVDVTFTAALSANNTPTIVSGLPDPTHPSALSAVSFTGGAGVIEFTPGAVITTLGTILLKEIVEGKIYHITGVYLTDA